MILLSGLQHITFGYCCDQCLACNVLYLVSKFGSCDSAVACRASHSANFIENIDNVTLPSVIYRASYSIVFNQSLNIATLTSGLQCMVFWRGFQSQPRQCGFAASGLQSIELDSASSSKSRRRVSAVACRVSRPTTFFTVSTS